MAVKKNVTEKDLQVTYKSKNIAVPELLYDKEGLKADFPNSHDLVKYVFKETGYNLKLQGRSLDF